MDWWPNFLPPLFDNSFLRKSESKLEVLRRLADAEEKAIEDYRSAAMYARQVGDDTLAEMFIHIMHEEEHHLEELNKRTHEFLIGGIR